MAFHTFSSYPMQFETVFLKCVGTCEGRGDEVLYFKITGFNAVTFDVKETVGYVEPCYQWKYYWLGEDEAYRQLRLKERAHQKSNETIIIRK